MDSGHIVFPNKLKELLYLEIANAITLISGCIFLIGKTYHAALKSRGWFPWHK
jgi:hypothetical protein